MNRKKPRLLLVNQSYHPDIAATAQVAHDLLSSLAERGWDVHVVASRSHYGRQGTAWAREEVVDGVRIHRVGANLFGKGSFVTRSLDYLLFILVAAWRVGRVRRPDVVVTLTTPPFLGILGYLLKLLRGSRFVSWVMDLYPELPVASGHLDGSSLLVKVLEYSHDVILRKADAVVVLGRCMKKKIRDREFPTENVEVLPLWPTIDGHLPVHPVENPLRERWAAEDDFVVMYSGNFGVGHDVETLCEAARRMEDRSAARFLWIGGGSRKAEVLDFIRSHDLSNCLVLPYVPTSQLPFSLASADVHVITLRPELEGLMVPSKTFNAMASGRPIVFIGPQGSEVARILKEADCGHSVLPGAIDELTRTLTRLENRPLHRQRLGENARASAGANYSREEGLARWRALLAGLLQRPQQEEPTCTRRLRDGQNAATVA